MKYIVSANYRDRESEYKYLVRRVDDDPEKAVACLAVRMNGVQFGESSAYEEGFGCSVVARCEEIKVLGAQGEHDLPTDHIRVHNTGPFHYIHFNGTTMCKLVPLGDEVLPSVHLSGSDMHGWFAPVAEPVAE